MSVWRIAIAFLVGAMLTAGGALAHEPKESAKSKQSGALVPLYKNLGDLTYRISTKNKLAQRYFNQGLRLTYAFNHAEALRAFREAQRQDPNCAMCYWGEAFVLGPNINAPMDKAAGDPAVAAIMKAKELAHHASAPEEAMIKALALRYNKNSKADRRALNKAYAEAMGRASKRFPDDNEIAMLYVDSLMNLSPWDYWEADGKTPKGKIGEAIRVTEKVLARSPNHPGAMHLYIHLTEASATPERAEPYADRLAKLMPGSGHLVHMGSHTFYRVGRYQDSAETNKAAVKVDEAYLAKVETKGIYAFGYYPHNIHFVLASAQMAGDRETALEYAKRLEGKIPDAIAAKIGWMQAVRTAPFFAHAHLGQPEVTLALPDPGDKFPLIKAMWHYARGVAYATQKDVEKARGEAAKISALNQKSDWRFLQAWAVPAPDLLRLARHVVEGRIAQAEGNAERAVKEFQVAASIQDTISYMEPPYWYYPVRQSLGAALVQAGKAIEAERVFERSLRNYPNNGWALYGLMKAQEAQGKDAAKETEKRFRQAWSGDPGSLSLNRL